jgi:hypothetical protein
MERQSSSVNRNRLIGGKITDSSDAEQCSLIMFIDVSEERATAIFRVGKHSLDYEQCRIMRCDVVWIL